MSRLTDLNEALSRPSSRAAWIPMLATPSGALGQCLQRADAHEAPETATPKAAGKPAPWSGLVQGIWRAVVRYRTARELQQLDAHLLADIGVERADIPEVAAKAARESTAVTNTATAMRLRFAPLAALRTAWTRNSAIHAFGKLPDHILRDIGIERQQIEVAVDRLMAGQNAKAKTRPVEPLRLVAAPKAAQAPSRTVVTTPTHKTAA